eukprot:3341160-Pleurochrysis_carterae.AAC.4
MSRPAFRSSPPRRRAQKPKTRSYILLFRITVSLHVSIDLTGFNVFWGLKLIFAKSPCSYNSCSAEISSRLELTSLMTCSKWQASVQEKSMN